MAKIALNATFDDYTEEYILDDLVLVEGDGSRIAVRVPTEHVEELSTWTTRDEQDDINEFFKEAGFWEDLLDITKEEVVEQLETDSYNLIRTRLASYQTGDIVLDALGRGYTIIEGNIADPIDRRGISPLAEALDYPCTVVARHGEPTGITVD